MYGGVEPPSSGSFSGRVVVVQQPQTNYIVNTNPTPTYSSTGTQTALYNANQPVYIQNPYGVGPLTPRSQQVVQQPPKIIIAQKPQKQQVIIRTNQLIFSADNGKPIVSLPLYQPVAPAPAPPAHIIQAPQEPNIILPYEIDCEIYKKEYGEDVNKQRFKTMLQHNNYMCIQPAETKYRTTIFVVYTNNLTIKHVYDAMNKVVPVVELDKKLSIKFLINEFRDIVPDKPEAKDPYHDGKYHAHQKIITFNDQETLTYHEWQRFIPYNAADKRSDLINNLILGAAILLSPEAINFCTNLNKFFAREYKEDKKVIPPPEPVKKSDDDDDDVEI